MVFLCWIGDFDWHEFIIHPCKRNKGDSYALESPPDVWHVENPRAYRTDYHTASLYRLLLWPSGSRAAISIMTSRNWEPIRKKTHPQTPSRIRPPMRLRGGEEWVKSRAEGEGVMGGMQTRCVSRFCNYWIVCVSHLHGDPPVDAAPQTDAGWRLHLVWRRSRCLVALPIWAHLQVFMYNI